MKTTMLIMAAGIGSRFGGGIKQLAPIDDKGHIIMDYFLYGQLHEYRCHDRQCDRRSV